MNPNRLAPETRILVLEKGEERYAVLFVDTDRSRTKALCMIRYWASNPELSLSLADMLVLDQPIRNSKPPEISR